MSARSAAGGRVGQMTVTDMEPLRGHDTAVSAPMRMVFADALLSAFADACSTPLSATIADEEFHPQSATNGVAVGTLCEPTRFRVLPSE